MKTLNEWQAIKEQIKGGPPLPPWFLESLLLEAISQLQPEPEIIHGFSEIAKDVVTERLSATMVYPFHLMGINDAFFVPCEPAEAYKMGKRLRRLAARQARRKKRPMCVSVHAGKKLANGQVLEGFYVVRRG